MDKKISFELYRAVSINDLILFCISSVFSKGAKCSFEKITKECFDLFPEAFCLKGIDEWPDSRKLDRPLRLMRKNKLVKGSPDATFILTLAGEKRARDTAKFLMQKKLKI